MSLLDDLQAVEHNRIGARCSVGTLLGRMTDEDRAVLLGWLADDSITSVRIATALRKQIAPTMGDSTIQRHRRGACSCHR